jgi:hypothetical protein
MTKRTLLGTGGMFAVSLVMLLLLGRGGWAGSKNPKQLDDFAKCLTEKNAVMYGSSTCLHCEEQREMFGKSFSHVRYVECSVRGSRQMSALCASAQIKFVPTWIFADGQRRVGVVSLEELSKRTGCRLP